MALAPAGPCFACQKGYTWSLFITMLGEIGTYIMKGFLPWNLFLMMPYFQWFQFLCSGSKMTDALYEKLNIAYAVHCNWLCVGFILTPILRDHAGTINDPRWSTGLDSGGAKVINVFDLMTIFTYAHTFCILTYLWALAVTKYPVACRLGRKKSSYLLAFWMVFAAAFDGVNVYYYSQLMQMNGTSYFAACFAINVIDILILIPLAHYCIVAGNAITNEKENFPAQHGVTITSTSAKVAPAS